MPINNTVATSYTFSGWVYSNGPVAEIYLFQNASGETGYFTAGSFVRTTTVGQWVKITGVVSVPASITSLNIRLDNNGNVGGTVWFDDVQLKKTSNASEIIEENNYYAFGMQHKGYNNGVIANGSTQAQKFKYNGKEFNGELNLNLYDYGARNYDPAIAKFFNIDRFAEKYYDKSPYHYAANNPILFIDVQGDSIRVANVKDQSKVLMMINSKTTGRFAFNKSGSLYLDKAGTSNTGSKYYTDKLAAAISSKEDINVSINTTFKNGSTGAVDNVDADHGGGVTDNYENVKVMASGEKVSTKVSDLVISGNPSNITKNKFGKPFLQSAADILMHELVGHAIPWIVGTDTGNAVKNENKVHKESKKVERQADPSHKE